MTTPEISAQRVARVGATLTAAAFLVVATLATPARADVPEGWSNPDDVDSLHALLLLAGAPLLLFVVITLLVYVPALARGERIKPGPAEPEDTWFGGPRRGAHELAGPDDSSSEAGGARGRW